MGGATDAREAKALVGLLRNKPADKVAATSSPHRHAHADDSSDATVSRESDVTVSRKPAATVSRKSNMTVHEDTHNSKVKDKACHDGLDRPHPTLLIFALPSFVVVV